MPSPIASPMPISPSRQRNLSVLTSPQDLFASLSATLASAAAQFPAAEDGGRLLAAPPMRAIQADDYSVPAPPPPSPVGFRADQWSSTTVRR